MQMHTGDFGDAPSSMKFFALLVAVTNVYLVNCRLVDSQIDLDGKFELSALFYNNNSPLKESFSKGNYRNFF